MSSDYSGYDTVPIDKGISSLSIHCKQDSEYANNRLSKYDSYQAYISRSDQRRRRLSSTGEGSGDSSTTTSGSSYGEREDVSEGRAESEESDDRDEALPLDGHVTETERDQVETFFRGLKTQVFVCGSVANLYTKSSADPKWQLKYTGIPVVILDVGEARSRSKRRIQIILAERGTGFYLWRDTIDNLSAYKMSGQSFHTMYYSQDHTLHIGISFTLAQASQEMWNHIERLISCPENISLSAPGKKKKKEKKPPKPVPLPPKSHISQPCCFQHVITVAHDDRSRYMSLKQLVPKITTFNARCVAKPGDF